MAWFLKLVASIRRKRPEYQIVAEFDSATSVVFEEAPYGSVVCEVGNGDIVQILSMVKR